MNGSADNGNNVIQADKRLGNEMIIGIDCETQGLEGDYILGAIAFENGKKTEKFYDRTEQWRRILEIGEKEARRGKNTYVYGHNVQFDLEKIAKEAVYDKEMTYYALNPFIAERGTIQFLDLYSIFKMSLEEVGKIVGKKKGKTHPKLLKSKQQKYSKEELLEIMEYCKRDAEIVMEAIRMLKGCFGKVGFRPKRFVTVGQLAMSMFVNHIKRTGEWSSIADYEGKQPGRNIVGTEHDKEARAAFRGARCQAFRIGEFKKTTCLDVNSLYPYIMATMDFPNLKSEMEIDGKRHKLNIEDLKGLIGMARAQVEVPKADIGFLPIRHKGKLLFPRTEGLTLYGVWTIRELELAKELGYRIKGIGKAVVYKKGENVMKEYLEMLYNMRQTEKGEMKTIMKLMMNNLFGKFGQNRVRKKRMWVDRYELQKYEKEGWRSDGIFEEKRLIWKEIPGERGYFVNPVIPMLISAGAREYLYKAIMKVGAEDILYCDTDSVMFKGDHKKKFKLGRRWGEWKVEFEKETLNIKGEKKYMYGDKVKLAGVRKRFQTPSSFRRGIVKHERTVGIIQSARLGVKPMTTEKLVNILMEEKKDDTEITENFIVDEKA